MNSKKYLPIISGLILCFTLALLTLNTTDAAKKEKEEKENLPFKVPTEVIEALKMSNLPAAIRNLRRIETDSPRAKYLLYQMKNAALPQSAGKAKIKDTKTLFNIGVAHHNLYLFLKGCGIDNEDFYNDALKYYKKAHKTKTPSRKNNVKMTMAVLYASGGNKEKAKKLFKKTDPELFNDMFRTFETFAMYYAAIGDSKNAIKNLESAYKIDSDRIKFWLEISDDFIQIKDDKDYLALLKKWEVKR